MKDKRPIEVQVAEMTEEQKNAVVKSFWIQIIAGILIALIALTPAICYTVAMANASNKYDKICAEMDTVASYDFSKYLKLLNESQDVYEEHQDLKKSRETSIWICIPIALVIGVTAEIIIRVKMPYYGDIKALHIMKQRRLAKKASKQQ